MQTGTTAVQSNNAIVTNLWNKCHLVKAHADIIIANIAAAKDPAVNAKILANTHIYRALALGTLATFWEKAPIVVGSNAGFSTRTEVLNAALSSIEAGLTAAAINSTSLTTGVNVINTLNALKARYNLMLGNYAAAKTAAGLVDLTQKSAFNFDVANINPMYETSFSNKNVCEPLPNFGLPTALLPDAADGRKAFYYNSTGSGNLALASFYTTNISAMPIYLPGEMTLIIAECNARLGDLPNAILILNKVLTKKTDAWGIGANLAAYSGDVTSSTAIFNEIYKQRCIELFLSGLKIEDSRRFGRPNTERTREFYPYPLTERNNNTSTPTDPSN